MKPKKNAFANSSTGYGKHHSKHNNSKSTKNDLNEKPEPKTIPMHEEKLQNALEQDKNLNSGFGDYLRTPEAVEMMKLFVFANTIMMILTMAWPNIKEMYIWFRQWLTTFESA